MEEKKSTALKVLKIVGTAFYVLITAVLVALLIASFPQDNGLEKLGFVLVVIVYSLIGLGAYLIPIIIGIVGAIMAKRRDEFGSVIYFVFMIVLPLVTDALFFCSLFLIKD